jgi:hypothetical protein
LVERRHKIHTKHYYESNRRWSKASNAKALRFQGSAPKPRASQAPVSATPRNKIASIATPENSNNDAMYDGDKTASAKEKTAQNRD